MVIELSFAHIPEIDLSAPIEAGPPPLRAHQLRAEEAIVGHFERGARRVIACGPTGCGKSRLGRAIADRFASPLCLTHTRPLFDQNRKTICRTVMVQQLVMAHKAGTLDALLEAVGDVDLVIADEAHHLASSKWSLCTTLWPNAKRLGLTATPMRGDGKPLRPYYDELVKIADYSELIKAQVLVPCHVERPTGTMARIGRSLRQNAAQAYMVHNGLRAIVFCEDTEHSRATTRELVAAGVRVAHVDGDTPAREREALFETFLSGGLEVLSNCDVLTEGVDLPCVEMVVLAKSYNTVGGMIQAAGRGLRSSPGTGKTELKLVDLVGCTAEFGAPDEDRAYSLDGRAMVIAPGQVWVCGVCCRNFSPKVAGVTADSWTDGGGEMQHRALSDDDIKRREAWVVAHVEKLNAKLTNESLTEKQVRKREKGLREYTRQLAAQVGAIVDVCCIPSDSKLKYTPCPHCLREKPRGNAKADLTRVVAKKEDVSFQRFMLTTPHNVGGALTTLQKLFDGAMGRGACLTSVADEYKRIVGVELKVGYARQVDASNNGIYRKYQEAWCQSKIKAGWKPGITFFRVTKFFGR